MCPKQAEQIERFNEVRKYIKEKVLNYAELSDLHYHIKLIKFIQEQPNSSEVSTQNSTVKYKTNANDPDEECKENEE